MAAERSNQKPAHGRNQAIELLRIVAAYGIVAYHSLAPFHDIAYSGLVVFLILSPYVDCAFNWDLPRPIKSLAKTLLVPWLFWFCFYGVLNITAHKPFFPAGHWIAGILYGTSAPLWFLPLMFAVLVLLNLLKGKAAPLALFWVSVLLAAVLLFTAWVWRPASMGWTPPLVQWMHSAPAIFIGMALGLSGRVPRSSTIPAVALLLLSLGAAVMASIPGVSIPYLIGVVAVVAAAWTGGKSEWNVRPAAACMLGVYLSHMAWLAVMNRITGQANYVTVTLTFLVALLTTWAMQRLLPAVQLVIGPAYRASRSRIVLPA